MFLSIVLVMSSCTKEEFLSEENVDELGMKTEAFDTKKVSSGLPLPEIVKNTIVIRYNKPDINIKEKGVIQKALMDKYKFRIKDTIECSCGATDIEKWILDPYGISIEDLVAALSENDAEDGVSGDHQFIFSVDNQNPTSNMNYEFKDKVLYENSKETVKIAILDTGIDYNYFKGQFLYDSSNSDNCEEEISGWDFVNGDNNPFDDNMHGTNVAKIIANDLNSKGIPFQFLNVKVFDGEGKGSYFEVLCGLKYIASFNEKFIVNASFGFYGLRYPNIMKDIIEANSEKLLVVNSSGNEGNDTDSAGKEHYPSGYNLDNMIVVGGYEYVSDFNSSITEYRNVRGYDVALKSNYGKSSVDVVAQFHHELKLSDTESASVSGTSFAAPLVTARAALLFYNNQQTQTPIALKYNVFGTTYTSSNLSQKIGSSRILFSNRMYVRNPNLYTLETP